MKYIMFEVQLKEVTVKIPVIFPDLLVHRDVADAVNMSIRHHYPNKTPKLVSAGFINVNDVQVHGRSETLNIDSNADADQRTILTADYGGLFK